MKPEALALFFDISVITIATAVVLLTLVRSRYILCVVSIFIWLAASLLFSIFFDSTTEMTITMGAFAAVITTALYLIRKTLPFDSPDEQR